MTTKNKKVDQDLSRAMKKLNKKRWDKATPADRKKVGQMLAAARRKKRSA
jgi:hypothetical protein